MDDIRPPRFDALAHRLWTRVVDGDTIDFHAWNRARAEGGFVATCRLCGGHVKPSGTETVGHIEWYEATCIICGKIIVSPNGRTLRRSSAHQEMPAGWWEYRERSLRGDDHS